MTVGYGPALKPVSRLPHAYLLRRPYRGVPSPPSCLPGMAGCQENEKGTKSCQGHAGGIPGHRRTAFLSGRAVPPFTDEWGCR